MLDLTGFRLMRKVAHGRSRSLACRESRRTSPSETPEAQHGRTIAFAFSNDTLRFQEDHLFHELGRPFFFASFLSFFSFSFSLFFFFFFWTRLLTLRNLRYVATRLRVRGPLHQSITAILTEEKGEEKQFTKPTHVAVSLFRDLDLETGVDPRDDSGSQGQYS